jgi:hypothetical protein
MQANAGGSDPDRAPLPENDAGPPKDAVLAASAYAPNAAARTAAARAAKDARWTVSNFGDAEDTLALRAESPPKSVQDHEQVARAAMQLGDLVAMREIFTRMPSPPHESASWYQLQVERGAWQCLLGDRARGLKELAVAVRIGSLTSPPFERGDKPHPARAGATATAKLASIACGGSSAGAWSDPSLATFEDTLALLKVPGRPAARPTGRREDELWDEARLADDLAASTATFDVLERVAPCSGSRSEHVFGALFFGPGTILEGDPFTNWNRYILGSIASYEAAGAKLEQLAGAAPAAAPCTKSSRGDTRGPRADVPKTLRRAAVRAWLLAGAESARRGDYPRALHAAGEAERLTTSDARPLSVAIRLLAHDVAGARAALAKSTADQSGDSGDKVAIELARALVAAQAGTYPEAFEASVRANALAANGEKPKHPPWGADALGTTMWLRAALAVKTRSRSAMLPLDTFSKVEMPGQVMGEASIASKMLDIIESPSPNARADARVKHCYIGGPDRMPTRVEKRVPWAPVFLIGAAVPPAEGEVEPWLDCAASFVGPLRSYWYARAEAARMRGDTKAAALWDARSRSVAALMKDDATAILAALAGY